MSEIQLSTMQIEDSVATLVTAVDTAFSVSEAHDGLYRPDHLRVPRPDHNLFKSNCLAWAEQSDVPKPAERNSRLEIGPAQAAVLRSFAGLRGFARLAVVRGGQTQVITGPAIVLPGGQHIAVLTTEQLLPNISTMQHAFLEAEYAKDSAEVSAVHSGSDVTNAGEVGPALIVASSILSANAHHDMHSLAAGAEVGKTFGSNFSTSGRQDFQVGSEVRRPRSTIVSTRNAVFYTGEQDQLPPEAKLLGVDLTADQLAVGMTLAATTSRHGKPDLAANLGNMVGA